MSKYSYKSMNAEPSRRFIASARCPSCHREDTLYFIAEIGGDHACIECGYDSSKASAVKTEAIKIIATPAKDEVAKSASKKEGRGKSNTESKNAPKQDKPPSSE